ncbi:hypothetical protein NQ314_021124 [Rhamnusium bicolor]|uniref:Uncharacterized protein n=1 Tax=Rhamnusium bicolor TaxID=1586634 RepID=A0AAV8WIY8_9CUCU|nr:hypothetical protein NQ314_021124 [Rhamnusium bicolor]
MPMEQKISSTKKQITDLQQNNSKISQVIRNVENSISSYLEKVDSLKDSIRTAEDDMNLKLSEVEQWDKEIEDVFNKLQEMKTLQKEAQAKCDASERVKQTISIEINKLTTHQKSLRDKKEEIVQAKLDDDRKIHSLENEMNRLENVKHSRLQDLQRRNQDAYKAVCWLRNNKHLFQGEIFEPIMLEVNVLDSRHAKYVENVIPLRDRFGFYVCKKGGHEQTYTMFERKAEPFY